MADGDGDVYGNGEPLVWFRCWCWVWVLLLVVLLLWFFLVFAGKTRQRKRGRAVLKILLPKSASTKKLTPCSKQQACKKRVNENVDALIRSNKLAKSASTKTLTRLSEIFASKKRVNENVDALFGRRCHSRSSNLRTFATSLALPLVCRFAFRYRRH